MIRLVLPCLLVLAVPTHEQSTPISPCPNVFSYESSGTEPGRWYGVVNLSTDSTLHSLWLNIVLDSKADILGNWVGDVSTSDNIDFKIENTEMKINPGPAIAVRFFVQYNPLNKTPKLQAIRLNGREICNANTPQPSVDRPERDENTNSRPVRPATTSRPQTTVIRPEDRPQTRPVPGRPTNVDRPSSGVGPVYERPPNQPNPSSIDGGSATQVVNNNPSQQHTTQRTPNYYTTAPPPKRTTTKRYEMPDFVDDNVRATQVVNNSPSQKHTTQRTTNYYELTTSPPSKRTTTKRYEMPDFVDDNVRATQVVNNSSSQKHTTQRTSNYYELSTSSTSKKTTSRHYDMPDFVDDNVSNDNRKPSSPDYFGGGSITFTIPNSGGTNSNKNKPQQREQQCGKVTLNNPIPLVVNGTPTLEGQWPWQIALYQTQTVDNKYICGGTLVTHKHIVTAAHCVTLKGSRRAVNKNTLTVYLGKHNLRTSVDGVQIRFVERIIVHPDYNATIFSRDIAILQLKEPVTYTDWVRPACLWPDNQIELNNVVGKKGSVVGWGYDDTGVATEELSLVEMPIVDQETCIRSYSEFFVRFTSEYTYCAGFRDGTSVCNGDSGGGMVFKLGGTWYVRGLVSVSVARENEYRCDPSHYVIFTDLAKFLPWIRQNVNDY